MVKVDVFKDETIGEDEHKNVLIDAACANKEKPLLKDMVSWEMLYDSHYHFRGIVNVKTHSEMLSHEQINHGMKKHMKFVNLITCFTP